MQVSEYQRAARTTAIYPAAAGVYYPALGLAGELGELANKAKKIIRGDFDLESRKGDFRGTGRRFVVRRSNGERCRVDLIDIAVRAEASVQQMTGDLYSTLLQLQKAAGDIAGIADDVRIHGLNEYRRALLASRLEVVLKGCARLCVILGAELADVCHDNIKNSSSGKRPAPSKVTATTAKSKTLELLGRPEF